MNKLKTCELVEELIKREGVQEIWANAEEKLQIIINEKQQAPKIDKGPVRILVIWD